MSLITSARRGIVAAVALATSALVLSAGAATATEAETAPVEETSTEVSELDRIRAIDPVVYERRVRKWINVQREKRDLKPVRANDCATGIARDWGQYLAENLEFYHQDLSPFFDKCNATYAGETLARGAVSPKAMVKLWMNSDGHRGILLSKYPNKIGLGAFQDSRGDWLVAADFIRK